MHYKKATAILLTVVILMTIPVHGVNAASLSDFYAGNLSENTSAGAEPGSKPETEPGSELGTDAGSEPGSKPETEPGSELGTDAGSEPETEPGSKPETEPGSKPGTDAGSEPGTEPESRPGKDTEIPSETDTDTNITKEPGAEAGEGIKKDQIETVETQRQFQSNQQLMANQQIVRLPRIEDDFRFVTVKKTAAMAGEEIVPVYEEMKEDSRKAGRMNKDDICYILKEEGEWAYIESGVVRGFVKSGMIQTGEDIETLIKQRESSFVKYELSLDQFIDSNASPLLDLQTEKQTDKKKSKAPILSDSNKMNHGTEIGGQVSYTLLLEELSEETDKDKDMQKDTVQSADDNKGNLHQVSKEVSGALIYAKALIDPLENKALAYTRTTTRRTLADKVYVIAQKNTSVMESTDSGAETVGKLKKDTLCYLLANNNADWLYVESGDVRGFVRSKDMLLGDEAKEIVEKEGEENLPLAEMTKEPKENKSLYYTFTSVKEGSVSGPIRTSMVDFALQFVGNPYVWGGTSLTNGADCSGFVQTIYSTYGYSIPRVAEDQAQYGTKIPVEDALPGDLIFYAKDGYIYHVVMYIGNGQTVQAANSQIGIITAEVSRGESVWAARIISDADNEQIEKVNQKAGISYDSAYTAASAEDIGELLGNFKLTAYCNCAVCCGQWADGATASGTVATQGRTVAIAGLPFGTRLIIGGKIYVVEDRGTPYGHVDIYLNSHEEAIQFGLQYGDVYLAK